MHNQATNPHAQNRKNTVPLHHNERLYKHVRYSCDDLVDVLSRKGAVSKGTKTARKGTEVPTKVVRDGITMR